MPARTVPSPATTPAACRWRAARRPRIPASKRAKDNCAAVFTMQTAKPVGANVVVHVAHALECRPGGINDEGGKSEKDRERLEPPHVGTGCFAKAALLRQGISVSHNALTLVTISPSVNAADGREKYKRHFDLTCRSLIAIFGRRPLVQTAFARRRRRKSELFQRLADEIERASDHDKRLVFTSDSARPPNFRRP